MHRVSSFLWAAAVVAVVCVNSEEYSFMETLPGVRSDGIKKCASGNYDSKEHWLNFRDNLTSKGLSYDTLDNVIGIFVDGIFKAQTRLTTMTSKTIDVSLTSNTATQKTYDGELYRRDTLGWASQSASVGLTVIIESNGSVCLRYIVSACSMLSISCSGSFADIRGLRIVL